MTRRRRTLFACIAAIALAFAQLAVSAHACGLPVPKEQGTGVVHPAGCEGAAQDEDGGVNLCEQHCRYGHASVDSNPPAPLSMHISGPMLKVGLSPVLPASPALASRRAVPAIGKPPPAILFGVLRI